MTETDIEEFKSKVNDLLASRGADSGVATLDAGGALPPDELLDSTSQVSDYTAANYTVILVDASSVNVIVYLPTAADNLTYYVKKIDTTQHSVFIKPDGDDKIDDADYIEIQVPYTCFTVHCDGSNWWII